MVLCFWWCFAKCFCLFSWFVFPEIHWNKFFLSGHPFRFVFFSRGFAPTTFVCVCFFFFHLFPQKENQGQQDTTLPPARVCWSVCFPLSVPAALRPFFSGVFFGVSFDALKVVHRVTPVGRGARYSITLYTPLAKCGFPIYLYEPLPAKMRRLTTPSHVMNLTSEPEKTQEHDGSRRVAREQFHHRSYEALLSHHLANTEHLWTDLPVPSVADPTDANLVKPKALLDCYKDAQEFMDEYDLNDGYDKGTLYLMRVCGHKTRMLSLFQALMMHAETNDRHGYL